MHTLILVTAILLAACGQNQVQSVLADDAADGAGLQTLGDYDSALNAARSSNKHMAIYFQHNQASDIRSEFEGKTIPDGEITRALAQKYVLLIAGTADTYTVNGNAKPLLSYFPGMLNTQGYALIHIKNVQGSEEQRVTVSEMPFVAATQSGNAYAAMSDKYRPWSKEQFLFLLTLDQAAPQERSRAFMEKFAPGSFKPQFSQIAVDMLAESNRMRAKKGKAAQELDESLVNACKDHAEFMARTGNLSHDTNGGVTGRAKRHGFNYRGLSENIAEGQTSVAEVFTGWWNSPGHHANMMGNYKLAGFGAAQSRNGTWFWVSMYGNR